MKSTEELKQIASQVRRDILRMTHAPQSGHPGGSLGCVELFVSLYFRVLKHDPKFSMDGKNESLFFLSNGHISPVWYSVLAHSGYFDKKELSTFRMLNSRLQGHPATHEHIPGVRIASGSLGQGLSAACGAALTKKLNQDKELVYCLCGDGEVQEGQIWEAAMFAVAHKVDNLIGIIDWNKQQIDGPIEKVLPGGDLIAKWEAFGWNVLETNGNNFDELLTSLDKAKAMCGRSKPVMILMHTEMGHGIDFMTNNFKWHGVAPNDEQLKNALSQVKETLGDY